MGLLDSVMGSVMGAAQGGQAGGLGADALMQVMGGLLGGGGAAPGGGAAGLLGLIQQFQHGGLGEVVQSWVGTGANLPVSAEQLQSVLGNGQLGALAQQVGLSPADLAGHLSQVLPQVIDHLTPGGQVPQGGVDLGQALGGLLGGLLKR